MPKKRVAGTVSAPSASPAADPTEDARDLADARTALAEAGPDVAWSALKKEIHDGAAESVPLIYKDHSTAPSRSRQATEGLGYMGTIERNARIAAGLSVPPEGE